MKKSFTQKFFLSPFLFLHLFDDLPGFSRLKWFIINSLTLYLSTNVHYLCAFDDRKTEKIARKILYFFVAHKNFSSTFKKYFCCSVHHLPKFFFSFLSYTTKIFVDSTAILSFLYSKSVWNFCSFLLFTLLTLKSLGWVVLLSLSDTWIESNWTDFSAVFLMWENFCMASNVKNDRLDDGRTVCIECRINVNV